MSRFGFATAAVVQSLVLLAFTVATFFVRERPGDALVPWGHARADHAPAAGHPAGEQVTGSSLGNRYVARPSPLGAEIGVVAGAVR